jgi:hypothetical protein
MTLSSATAMAALRLSLPDMLGLAKNLSANVRDRLALAVFFERLHLRGDSFGLHVDARYRSW